MTPQSPRGRLNVPFKNLISEQNIIVIEVADEVYDNLNFEPVCKRFKTTRNYFDP